MDPSSVACPILSCRDKGVVGMENIGIHSRVDARYICRTCGHTFAATTNTPFYRLHHPPELMTLVLTLLVHGCPPAAIVAAFGLDERTVRAARDKCRRDSPQGKDFAKLRLQRFANLQRGSFYPSLTRRQNSTSAFR